MFDTRDKPDHGRAGYGERKSPETMERVKLPPDQPPKADCVMLDPPLIEDAGPIAWL